MSEVAILCDQGWVIVPVIDADDGRLILRLESPQSELLGRAGILSHRFEATKPPDDLSLIAGSVGHTPTRPRLLGPGQGSCSACLPLLRRGTEGLGLTSGSEGGRGDRGTDPLIFWTPTTLGTSVLLSMAESLGVNRPRIGQNWGMSPRRPSNRASLDQVLRRLRSDDRLDDLGEVIDTAARTCAAEVDAACAADSDVPSYAKGRIIAPICGRWKR